MENKPPDESEPASLSDKRRAHAKSMAQELLAGASGENALEQAIAARDQAESDLARAHRQIETIRLVRDILDGVVDENEFVQKSAEELAADNE